MIVLPGLSCLYFEYASARLKKEMKNGLSSKIMYIFSWNGILYTKRVQLYVIN